MVQLRKMLSAVVLVSSMLTAAAGYAATTELMSVTSAGDPVTSGNFQVSDNGRFVFFITDQPNIVPGFSSINSHAYVHDRATGTTELVSTDASGTPLLAVVNVYLPMVSRFMSADGRYVMFSGPGELVYVKDRTTGALRCVSIDSAGNPIRSGLGSISADGQTVAFTKSNKEQTGTGRDGEPVYTYWDEIWLTNMATGVAAPIISDINPGRLGRNVSPSLSATGRYVAFTSTLKLTAEPLNSAGIYVYDTVARAFERIDTNADGCVTSSVYGNTLCDSSAVPTISNDGRFVSYRMNKAAVNSSGDFTDTAQLYVADRTTRTQTRTDFPFTNEYGDVMGGSYPKISADGNHVIFSEWTGRLNPTGAGISDLFVFERASGNIARVNLSTSGVVANDEVFGSALSADASVALFSSSASNIVPGVAAGKVAVFVKNTGGQGYPLSFTVTKAVYEGKSKKLTVEATSSKGASANMEVLNNGTMSWNARKNIWSYSRSLNVQPASVVVGNAEGYKIVPVVTPTK